MNILHLPLINTQSCTADPGVYVRASAYSDWILANLNVPFTSTTSIKLVKVTSKYKANFISDYNELTTNASLVFISNYKTFVRY